MKTAVSLALLLLGATTARADLVTIVASGDLTSFSDPQGLLPFTESDALGGFTLTLTYDDTATTDTSADPSIGIYLSAIQSMQLTVGSRVIAPWLQKSVLVLNDRPQGSAATDLWDAQTVQSTALNEDGARRQESFDLQFGNTVSGSTAPPLTSAGLVQPPWPSGWLWVDIRYKIDDYDATNAKIGAPASALARVENLTITASPVPLPATAWLFLTALALPFQRVLRRHCVSR
jgi:hypothetical protein